jgi:hypothetical protein
MNPKLAALNSEYRTPINREQVPKPERSPNSESLREQIPKSGPDTDRFGASSFGIPLSPPAGSPCVVQFAVVGYFEIDLHFSACQRYIGVDEKTSQEAARRRQHADGQRHAGSARPEQQANHRASKKDPQAQAIITA